MPILIGVTLRQDGGVEPHEECRIVEGESFGAPVPGKWPGGPDEPMTGQDETDHEPSGPESQRRRPGLWRRFLEALRAVPR